uniref:Uncharacterized protein n=1 Tax=Roseihalotalea indica TaxID=2867963 RepID=A0AA49JEX9_9BACT|nr:hypothetical protein K4G66_03930 [Tunicatimonas sp. TK19036]
MKKSTNLFNQLRNLCDDLLDVNAMSTHNAMVAQEMLIKYRQQALLTQAMLLLQKSHD